MEDKIMKVILKNNSQEVAILYLDIDNEILKSVEIIEGQERMAKIYFPKINDNPRYRDFEKLYKFYLDDKTDIKLAYHLTAIENGDVQFNTQYRRNLNIEAVEEN